MNDSWAEEQAHTAGSAQSLAPKKGKSRNDVVRDDWEDDDDEEDDNPVEVEEHNKRIWNEANARESRQMPCVVMSRGLSVHNTLSSLPLNEPPTMRILKRPSPSSGIPKDINMTTGESLLDREARYLAARERIFGTSGTGVEDETNQEYQSTKKPSSSLTTSSQVIRELRGPTLGDESSSHKGFVDRIIHQSKNTGSSPSKGQSEDVF